MARFQSVLVDFCFDTVFFHVDVFFLHADVFFLQVNVFARHIDVFFLQVNVFVRHVDVFFLHVDVSFLHMDVFVRHVDVFVLHVGRMSAEIIRSTIRPEAGKSLDDVATVIARIRPKGSTSPRLRPLKLYAVKGTKFYEDLLAERDQTGPAPKFQILGIFTLDPFSVLRTLEDPKFRDGEWTPVGHPVSLVVFGRL